MGNDKDKITAICKALGWSCWMNSSGEILVSAGGVTLWTESRMYRSHFLVLATCEMSKKKIFFHYEMYGGGRPAVWMFGDSYIADTRSTEMHYLDPADPESYQAAWLSALDEAAGWIDETEDFSAVNKELDSLGVPRFELPTDGEDE